MEYAGYVRRGAPTDWSKVTGGIAQRLSAVEEGREKEREKLDTIFSESKKAIREVELGQNETNNQMILTKSQEGREGIYQDYKDLKAGILSPSDYRRRNNNRQDSWGELNTAMKQQNSRLEVINKSIQNGTASGEQMYKNERAALRMASDGYKYIWGEDGTLVSAKTDAQGKIIPNTIMPVSSLNKTQNVLIEKFNVTQKVGAFTKDLGKFKDQFGNTLVSGYEAIPEYETLKKRITKSIIGNPEDAARALIDSSEKEYYYYEDEAEIGDKDPKLGIKMVLGTDGVLRGQPTEEQIGKARELVEEQIKYGIGLEKKKVTDTTSKTERNRQKTSLRNYETAVSASQGHNLERLVGYEVGKYTIEGTPIDQGDNIRITLVKGQGDKRETVYRDVPKGDAVKMMQFIANSKNYGAAKTSFEEGRGLYMGAHEGKEFTIEESELQPLSKYDFAGLSDEEKENKIEKYRKLQLMQTGDEESEEYIIDELREEIWGEIDYSGSKISKEDIKIKLDDDEQKFSITIEGVDEPFSVEMDFKDWIGGIGAPKPQQMAKKIEEIVNAYIDQENVLRGEGKADVEEEVVEKEKIVTPPVNKAVNEKQRKALTAVVKNKDFHTVLDVMENNIGRIVNGKAAATPQPKGTYAKYDGEGKIAGAKPMKNKKPKVGIKTLFPELKDSRIDLMSTPQGEIVRMMNLNTGWDPRVAVAIAQKLIPASERGAYHNGTKDIATVKGIDLHKVDANALLKIVDDIYQNTYDDLGRQKKGLPPVQYDVYKERIKLMAERHGLTSPVKKKITW